ncbi:MAG: cytochrome c3 family protein, partial [Bryobacteraceae bacterium]
MARFLQAITGLGVALLGASLSGAPFSHKLHLKLKLDCVTCHTAAPGSKALADNNLPRPDVCRGCHASSTIKTPRTTNLSRFNHELHLKFGNIASLLARAIDTKAYLSDPGDLRRFLNSKNPCIACHRGLEESETVTRAAHPQMADCLVCHSKVDPPFSC